MYFLFFTMMEATSQTYLVWRSHSLLFLSVLRVLIVSAVSTGFGQWSLCVCWAAFNISLVLLGSLHDLSLLYLNFPLWVLKGHCRVQPCRTLVVFLISLVPCVCWVLSMFLICRCVLSMFFMCPLGTLHVLPSYAGFWLWSPWFYWDFYMFCLCLLFSLYVLHVSTGVSPCSL